MSFYPPKVGERFHAPENAGQLKDTNAAGICATFVCGAVLRFTLLIDKQSKIIERAKFQTDGCGFLIAAADALAEKITGKKLSELHGLDESVLTAQIETELEIFPENRRHCLEICVETLQAAFNDFRAAQLEEWTGEKALICTCFGVSEETIENLVKENSLQTVEEVTEACNAGGGCGACQPLIQEIIDSRELEKFF
ncbi:MAG: iron-sulfur cluster assembly scaffold protein [Pyrinomonadaceae bacterium]